MADEFSEGLRALERETAKLYDLYTVLEERVESLNTQIRHVEDWIMERKRLIDATETIISNLEGSMSDRIHAVEQDLDRHQSFIDEHRGEKTTWSQLLLVIGVMISAVGGIVQMIKFFSGK